MVGGWALAAALGVCCVNCFLVFASLFAFALCADSAQSYLNLMQPMFSHTECDLSGRVVSRIRSSVGFIMHRIRASGEMAQQC